MKKYHNSMQRMMSGAKIAPVATNNRLDSEIIRRLEELPRLKLLEWLQTQELQDVTKTPTEKGLTEVRVLESSFMPEMIDTEDTVGARVYGVALQNAFRHLIYVKYYGLVGLCSTATWFIGAIVVGMMMAEILPYSETVDIVCGVLMFQNAMVFVSDLNAGICKKLLRRFEVWFNVLNSVGYNLAMIVLLDGKHICSVALGWMCSIVIIWFTDAMSPRKRQRTCRFIFPLLFFLTMLFQIGLIKKWIPVASFSYDIGGLQWTPSGHAVSSMGMMMLFFARYFVTSITHPNDLLFLKAPLTSNKATKTLLDIKKHALQL